MMKEFFRKNKVEDAQTKTEKLKLSSETRKGEVRRAYIKKILVALCVVFVIAVFAIIAALRLRDVRIDNKGWYDNSRIEEIVEPGKYRNYLFYGRNALRNELETKLPYLDNVTVEATLQGLRLNVTANYTTAAYAIESNDRYILLNDCSKVLETDIEVLPQGIPVIKGLEPAHASIGTKAVFAEKEYPEYIKNLLDVIGQIGIQDVTEYDLSDLRDIKVFSADGGEFRFGKITDFSITKIQFIKQLYNINKAEDNQKKYIIEVKDGEDGYIRHLDETVPQSTEPEIITDENGEAVTDTTEAPSTDVPSTEAPSTETPSTEESYSDPLEEFHNSTPAEPSSAHPLDELHGVAATEADASQEP